jgi:hypothetical protein
MLSVRMWVVLGVAAALMFLEVALNMGVTS